MRGAGPGFIAMPRWIMNPGWLFGVFCQRLGSFIDVLFGIMFSLIASIGQGRLNMPGFYQKIL